MFKTLGIEKGEREIFNNLDSFFSNQLTSLVSQCFQLFCLWKQTFSRSKLGVFQNDLFSGAATSVIIRDNSALFLYDTRDFTVLPAQGLQRDSVSLLDVM